jgi:DMSO/TMAO reductase YedYZ heme-binding membrane subunit
VNALLATGGSKTLWFATRGSGTVAFLTLTATVVLGILGTQRLDRLRVPRFLVAGLHRNLTLLALAVLSVHIGTAVADSYAPVGVKDAFIPFVSAYRPIWLGLGALAFDLLLALTITSLLRTRIGLRRWKALHWLAYAAWPVALVHALGTGSDAQFGWMKLLGVIATLMVVASVLVRLWRAEGWTRERLAGVTATLVVPVAILTWYETGPAKHGWAAHAGTPTRLVASKPAGASTATARVAPASSPALPKPPFTTHFSGRLRQSTDTNGLTLIDITGKTSRRVVGRLWIRLQGQPVGGGVALTASGASFGPNASPEEYLGSVTALNGPRIALALRSRTGTLQLTVDVSINRSSGAVSGVVHAEPGPSEAQ